MQGKRWGRVEREGEGAAAVVVMVVVVVVAAVVGGNGGGGGSCCAVLLLQRRRTSDLRRLSIYGCSRPCSFFAAAVEETSN